MLLIKIGSIMVETSRNVKGEWYKAPSFNTKENGTTSIQTVPSYVYIEADQYILRARWIFGRL